LPASDVRVAERHPAQQLGSGPGRKRAFCRSACPAARPRGGIVRGTASLVAGIDVGFEDLGRITRAAVAVLRCRDLQLVESALAPRRIRFPDVPGLLSFREIPRLSALACTPAPV
jgi:hypothetical protein